MKTMRAKNQHRTQNIKHFLMHAFALGFVFFAAIIASEVIGTQKNKAVHSLTPTNNYATAEDLHWPVETKTNMLQGGYEVVYHFEWTNKDHTVYSTNIHELFQVKSK